MLITQGILLQYKNIVNDEYKMRNLQKGYKGTLLR
jgi:hypothetical protein